MKVNLGKLTVTSPAFKHGERMPDDQSGNGAGVSPELSWSDVPEGTQSFALIAHDPDAPLVRGFTHWVIYGIPGEARGLPEGADTGFTAGVHGAGAAGFAPAGPPPGHGVHFYYFHLYALDKDLGLPPGLTADELLERLHHAHGLRQIGRAAHRIRRRLELSEDIYRDYVRALLR